MVPSNLVYRGDSVKDQRDRGSKFKDFGPPRGINLAGNNSQVGGSVRRIKYCFEGNHAAPIIICITAFSQRYIKILIIPKLMK